MKLKSYCLNKNNKFIITISTKSGEKPQGDH